MKKLLQFAFLLAFVGCASPKQYVPFPDQSVEIQDPAKARIYVIRPTSFGSAVKIKVHDGIQEIGVTGPSSFLSWESAPGDYLISSKAENRSHLMINAEAGQTYYIQQHIRMGLLYARNWLEELDKEEALKFLEKAKPPKLPETLTEPTVIG